MSFTYLASPYSHSDAKIVELRYLEAIIATKWLLKQRIWTFSPIVHCHAMAHSHDLPTDFAFWRDYNFAMLEKANRLLILAIDGWKESKGVTAEAEFAHDNNITIEFLAPEGKWHTHFSTKETP